MLYFRDHNTLFRGNNLLTELVAELMKLVGLPYLHNTLKPILDQVRIWLGNRDQAGLEF